MATTLEEYRRLTGAQNAPVANGTTAPPVRLCDNCGKPLRPGQKRACSPPCASRLGGRATKERATGKRRSRTPSRATKRKAPAVGARKRAGNSQLPPQTPPEPTRPSVGPFVRLLDELDADSITIQCNGSTVVVSRTSDSV